MMRLVTESWVQHTSARQYRLYDGYVTNCLIGMCKNPDAMCDALNGATVESGEYAITLNSVCGEHLESQVWLSSYNKDILNELYLQVKIGNLQTTKTILEYAEAHKKDGLSIEKSYAWRKLHDDWKSYGELEA